jgi:hypothetical protein
MTNNLKEAIISEMNDWIGGKYDWINSKDGIYGMTLLEVSYEEKMEVVKKNKWT